MFFCVWGIYFIFLVLFFSCAQTCGQAEARQVVRGSGLLEVLEDEPVPQKSNALPSNSPPSVSVCISRSRPCPLRATLACPPPTATER